jgi:hypothetical protein
MDFMDYGFYGLWILTCFKVIYGKVRQSNLTKLGFIRKFRPKGFFFKPTPEMHNLAYLRSW